MDEKQRRNIIRKIREKSDKISMRWQAAMAGLPPPLLSGVASSTVPAAPAAGVKVATAKEPTPPSKPPLPPDLFCDTIRNWVETLTSQLSGIERIRCLHDPARDKAVVIFGERHGVKEAGKQSLKESFIHLLHILKPAKVDLMVEMREWKRRNKERKSFGVTEIQKVRDWADHCIHHEEDEKDFVLPKSCPAYVRFSWLDPYGYTDVSEPIFDAPNKGETTSGWPSHVRERIKTTDDLFTHLMGFKGATGGSRRREDRVGSECAKAGISESFVRKHWQSLYGKNNLMLAAAADDMQRFAMDVFTVCRIIRTSTRGWRRLFIIYEGAWHADNTTTMLKDLGFYVKLDWRRPST